MANRRPWAVLPVALALVGVVTCSGDDDRPVVPPQSADWERRPLTEDFTVQVLDLSDRRTVGDPLDAAIGPDGTAWVIGEFGTDLVRIDGSGAQVVPTPRTAGDDAEEPFADPFHGEDDGPDCRRTTRSALGERVIVTETGDVWFTHGGALFPPEACEDLNHSRVVRFDPDATDDPGTADDERFCIVPLPGVNGQVIAVAHDPRTDRLWFTLPSGSAGPALGWFVAGAVECAGRIDYSDPEAVDAAVDRCPPDGGPSGCIQLVEVDDGVYPTHLAMDQDEGRLWFTDYAGKVLGRVPLDGEPEVELVSLPAPTTDDPFGSYPWQIVVTPTAVLFVEFHDNEIVRLRTTGDCAAPDPGCFDQLALPVEADEPLHAHSLALDGDRLWFTLPRETGRPDAGGASAVGHLDLTTWESGGTPRGVVHDELGAGEPTPGAGPRALRGIALDAGTGRVVIADRADQVLVLTPR